LIIEDEIFSVDLEVSVATLNVKPDRYEDFLETSRKAKAVLEKCREVA
jgi:hypothetical protein